MPDRQPDAVLIPLEFKTGKDRFARVDSMCTLAESILGLDRSQGKTAYLRTQEFGEYRGIFATGSPEINETSLYYGFGHPLEGKPRYTWEAREDGIRLGYLKEAPSAS